MENGRLKDKARKNFENKVRNFDQRVWQYNVAVDAYRQQTVFQFISERLLSGQVRDDIFAAVRAEASIFAGLAELYVSVLSGGAAGAFIGLHGLGNLAGGIGDYVDIFDGGGRDYNITRQGYENLFSAAGQNPQNGARAFYLTDALIGVGALFSVSSTRVAVQGPYTIEGTIQVRAYQEASRPILIHDVSQIGLSVESGTQ